MTTKARPKPIMSAEEMFALSAAVRSVPATLHMLPLLEVGTGMGGSALVIDDARKAERNPAEVHTVDYLLLDRGHTGGRDQRQAIREAFADRPNIVFHEGRSADLRAQWKQRLSFLFIDATHTKRGVTEDIQWTEFLEPGGVLVFHDYGAPHIGNDGVRQAIQEWKHRVGYQEWPAFWRQIALVGSLLVLRKA